MSWFQDDVTGFQVFTSRILSVQSACVTFVDETSKPGIEKEQNERCIQFLKLK